MNMYFQMKALLFLLGQTGQIVFGTDDFGNEKARSEYLTVFKNVPTLFEYLLDTLEENPEILEKNNADVFKAADDDVSNDVTRFQRSVYVYRSEQEDIKVEKDQENEGKVEKKSNEESNLKHGEGKSEDINNIHLDEIVHDATTRKRSIDVDKIDKNAEDTNQSLDRDDQKNSDEVDSGEVFQALVDYRVFRLSSEEIAEQALKVEEMLEQHNSSK